MRPFPKTEMRSRLNGEIVLVYMQNLAFGMPEGSSGTSFLVEKK
jgi:hypothetical protein